MANNFFTTTTEPVITTGATAFTADDAMFDWTPIQIPKGSCALASISGYIMGKNGDDQATSGILDLFFAKSINGVAPPTIGTINSGISKANAVAFRRHLIGYMSLDMDERTDSTDPLASYNAFGLAFNSTVNNSYNPIIMQGEALSGDTGFQTIYVAGAAQAGFDFGTGVLCAGENAAGNLAIVIDNGSGAASIALDTFAIGDEVVLADDTRIGTITALTNVLMTVDTAPATLADNAELVPKFPLRLTFGWEY
mgnify:FL=1